jgi:uncharacterized protein (TIGR03083 family)
VKGMLDREQYLAVLAAEVAAFLPACERAGFSAPVPPCPGWSVSDLVWHLTEVHHFWSWIVEGAHQSPEGYEQPTRPVDDAALVALYESTARHMLDVLAGADTAATVWAWTHDHTAGFVLRRMAQETAVHRIDADLAAGVHAQMDAMLASDGIDEFLEHFLADGSAAVAAVGGSVHLHCADVAGEWTVRPGSVGWELTREHAKGDCALRGAAVDLLMVLWRRSPLSMADVVGDAAVAERFVAVSSLQ